MNIHLASCTVWVTANAVDCDCNPYLGWAIRKDPSAPLHTWRIFRRTNDNELLPMMRCSTFTQAVAMVSALIRVRSQAFGESDRAH